MIVCMMLMSVGAFAQAGTVAVGPNVGIALYGNSYNPFGVGAKLQYEFIDNFRGEVAYNFWFPKNDQGIMDIDFNFQYLIPIAEGVKFYPIAGVNMGITHGDVYKEIFGEQQSLFGIQGGVGIEYYVAENIKLNVDAKYQYNKRKKSYDAILPGLGTISSEWEMKYDGPVFQAGVAFIF